MIPIPVWALLGLILATIVFGWLGLRWQRHAQQLQEQLDVAFERVGKARLAGWCAGSVSGYKRGWGASYQAAAQAQRRGDDVLQAIVALGGLPAESPEVPA